MFDKKLSNLLSNSTVSSESFIEKGLKVSHETLSGNGSLKYDTTGDDFLDQFASAALYKEPRSYNEVAKDMQLLWSQNPLKALKLTLYFRMITRKSLYIQDIDDIAPASETTKEVQRGQGLKNEGIMRMMWVAINHPEVFKANIYYYIAAGCWKDIFQMLSLDLQYNGWRGRKLDWYFMYNVILSGLLNPETTHLVRKYMPTIRNNKSCTTIESQANTLVGRWLAKKLYMCDDSLTETDKILVHTNYRKIKSAGVAHDWQQKISKQLYNQINFDTIAGRALAQLVGSKFLANHGLEEKYEQWMESKPIAKYTGYVHELFKDVCDCWKNYQKMTLNAQFKGLVELGKTNAESKLLVVRDTSGSMTTQAKGTNMSSFDIAKALALYFSEMLEGKFKGCFAEFSRECRLLQWKGSTPFEKWVNDRCNCIGNTDFNTVAELLVRIKKEGVTESEFPNGVLCISDGEFDGTANETAFHQFRRTLLEGGFSNEYVDNFKLILWDIPNSYYGRDGIVFEDFADAPNCYYMSGYDPSVISFIFGNKYTKKEPKNAKEVMEAALNQELLNLIYIPKKGK